MRTGAISEANPGQWINFVRGSKFAIYLVKGQVTDIKREWRGTTYQNKNVCSIYAYGWGRNYTTTHPEITVRIFDSEEEFFNWIRKEEPEKIRELVTEQEALAKKYDDLPF